MSENQGVHTHTKETHVERRGSGGTGVLAFIVGGLVVAVGVLGFVFWSGGAPEASGSSGSAGGNASESTAEPDESSGDAAEPATDDTTGED